MNKAQRKKMERALARAPAPGQCPLAPPRRLLKRAIYREGVYGKMREKMVAAFAELGRAQLRTVDLMMRVQCLEKQIAESPRP